MDIDFVIKTKELGNRLKEIRKTIGVTKYTFSKELGVDERLIFETERNNTLPGYFLIQKLYDVYRVSPNYLLLGHGQMFLDRITPVKYNGPDLVLDHEDLTRIIILMGKSPLLKYAVLSFASQYLHYKKILIEGDIAEYGDNVGSLCLNDWGKCEPIKKSEL